MLLPGRGGRGTLGGVSTLSAKDRHKMHSPGCGRLPPDEQRRLMAGLLPLWHCEMCLCHLPERMGMCEHDDPSLTSPRCNPCEAEHKANERTAKEEAEARERLNREMAAAAAAAAAKEQERADRKRKAAEAATAAVVRRADRERKAAEAAATAVVRRAAEAVAFRQARSEDPWMSRVPEWRRRSASSHSLATPTTPQRFRSTARTCRQRAAEQGMGHRSRCTRHAARGCVLHQR